MSASPLATQAPFSQEAEEAVLGAILINPDSYLTIASFLATDDFFILRHRHIWDALSRISQRNEKPDFVTVQDELRAMGVLTDVGGPAFILNLINNTPTSIHAEVYARLVERASTRRKLLAAADQIKGLALDESLNLEKVVSESETRLFGVTENTIRRDIQPIGNALNEYFERVELLMQSPAAMQGLPTGFRDLDQLLGGLQRSDLLIFAGRPGMGKCVTGDTLISTEHGLVTIESLKPARAPGIPDDEGGTFYPLDVAVQTPDGLRNAAWFYDSGVKPTRRIQTRAGYALSGTLVHPVLTLNTHGEKAWKTLGDIEPGDYVAVQRHEAAWGHDTRLPDFTFEFYRSNLTLQPALPTLLEPRFYWDEIVCVEDAGLQHCYDLTVPDGHAFISNGIVSHNTSFLLSVALNAAKVGARIAIFTMEMGADQIVQRFVAMETGINTQKLRTGQLTQQEYSKFVHSAGTLGSLPIFIDDTPSMTPVQMRTKCRRVQHEYGLDLVIVDYLQLMNGGGSFENNRVQEISYISRSMKEMARELQVPVFSAAQLSRAVEQRQDKHPQLSDLRESGSLEQDADIVAFLYREVVYNEATENPSKAEVIIAKHRNGPTDTVSLHYERQLTKFLDARPHKIDLSAY